MALTAIDIYKLLPKTNCKKCGQSTCLAFAMQIAAGKASIDLCPPSSEEAREKLSAAAAPPLPKVTIGTGEREVVLGDETVLFRHEKTFYHPTAIAVSIRDEASDEEF
ncbi:MAG TPA: (Fe-S)-binding protein, partial [Candidatus Deferrimicrobium sp.]